jgi:hypothetical protein
MHRLPVQFFGGTRCLCDQHRRVSGAALLDRDRDWSARDFSCPGYDLLDAASDPGAKVVGGESTLPCRQRCNVRGSEIRDVDEVADAGTVRRVIVIAEYRYAGALVRRGLKDDRDQVCLRVVLLSDLAV